MKRLIHAAGALLIGAALCAAQPGPPSTDCSNLDFVGKYAFQASGYDMRASPPSPVSIAGAFEVDGEGGFISWGDWLQLAGNPGPAKRVLPNDLVASAAAAGSELRYEVGAGCQMRIFGTVMGPAGPLPLELLGGLAGGGSKALLQMGSPVFIGPWTAERSEARVRDLVERVAGRLSVPIPR